jgi:hypothetical protein
MIKEKKICSKCGEIYRLSSFCYWQIFRSSGIPYVKDEYSVMICEMGAVLNFPIQPPALKLDSKEITYYVNKYDEDAINEIEINNRCIMKDCDGLLENFEEDEFEYSEKRKEENYPKYFGTDYDENNDDDLDSTIESYISKI